MFLYFHLGFLLPLKTTQTLFVNKLAFFGVLKITYFENISNLTLQNLQALPLT